MDFAKLIDCTLIRKKEIPLRNTLRRLLTEQETELPRCKHPIKNMKSKMDFTKLIDCTLISCDKANNNSYKNILKTVVF